MLGKGVGLFITGVLVVVFSFQITGVSAHGKDKPVTGPVTSPVTSATDCKFGWGFGDKNHCHYGPWGWLKKHVTFSFFSHHEDKHDDHHDDDHHDNNKNNNKRHR